MSFQVEQLTTQACALDPIACSHRYLKMKKIHPTSVVYLFRWTWRSQAESKSEGVSGTIAYYTGSGYYLDLGTTRPESEAMLKELFEGLWTDEATRAIIIDFTLYNANLNLFCIGQYVIRFCQQHLGYSLKHHTRGE